MRERFDELTNSERVVEALSEKTHFTRRKAASRQSPWGTGVTYLARESMPLYSSETPANATKGKLEYEPKANSGSEEKSYPVAQAEPTWSYLFVHYRRTEVVQKELEKEFQVFVHTSLRYRKGDKRKQGKERPTISGLVFVKGEPDAIQRYLSEKFIGLYLAKDHTTGKRAVITDAVMRPFMQISKVQPTRIRFMPHSFDYYSEGHPMVRITSGPLIGLEGYRIRISRDKCFIASMGGLTIAVGGIHADTFENIEEARQAAAKGNSELQAALKALDSQKKH